MLIKYPILFLIFNRPEVTKTTFQQIKRYQPDRLYIAADGPRKSIPDEKDLCDKTRELVLSKIDWPCEVKTLFRNENLGCGVSIPEAISWFFTQEEMGVILEDDVLVHDDFFSFSAELLEKYKNDERVMMISGFNYRGENVVSDKYFFTVNPFVSGWATWKRAWDLCDLQLTQWPQIQREKVLRYVIPGIVERYRKNKQFKAAHGADVPDIWDTQWAFSIIVNEGKVVLPEANLCRHIGLDSGTHFNKHRKEQNSTSGNIGFGELVFPLANPKSFVRNYSFEKKYAFMRLVGKLKRMSRVF